MTTIDLEPTYVELYSMVKSGHLKIEFSELQKACVIADIVRQAQKSGKPSLTFTFNEDGSCQANDGN
jgi:hypothetical protein